MILDLNLASSKEDEEIYTGTERELAVTRVQLLSALKMEFTFKRGSRKIPDFIAGK